MLLYAELLLFGGNDTDLALCFSGSWFIALALLMTRGWAQHALDSIRLTAIGLPFVVILSTGVLMLTPVGVGGPHPVWTWTPGARVAGSIDPYLTIIELIKLTAFAATFLIGAVIGVDGDRAKSLLRWLLLLGLFYSLWAFIDHVTSPNWLFGAPRLFAPNRLSASLVSPNTAAVFFGSIVLLNLGELEQKIQPYGNRSGVNVGLLEVVAPSAALPLISLVAAMTCLILTLSRVGILVTVATVALLTAIASLARLRRRVVISPLLATAAIVITVVLASSAMNVGSLEERIGTLNNDMVARNAIFTAHWAAFRGAPLWGYGLGTFAHVNSIVMSHVNVGTLSELGAAHNVYLQWLEQAGLLGAVSMFTCAGLVSLQIARLAVGRQDQRSGNLAILGVLLLMLAQGAMDFALEVPAVGTFASLLLGIAYGPSAPIRGRRSRAEQKDTL